MMEKAFSIDAFPPPLWEFHAGNTHLLLRQYDEALVSLNRMVERAPKFVPAYVYLAWAYVEQDRLDDANDAIKTLLEIAPKYTLKELARIYSYRLDEHRNRFLDNLRKTGLPEG